MRCTPLVYMTKPTRKGDKTRSVGLSLNYICASTTRQAWESFMIFLEHQPVICNYWHPLGVRGLGPIRLGGHSGGGVHMMVFTEKVIRQGVTGWTASPKGNHMIKDG